MLSRAVSFIIIIITMIYHSGETLGWTSKEDARAAAPSDAANAAVLAAVDAAAGARVARCADGAHPVALKD